LILGGDGTGVIDGGGVHATFVVASDPAAASNDVGSAVNPCSAFLVFIGETDKFRGDWVFFFFFGESDGRRDLSIEACTKFD
jgi:hypothetical protein